MGQLQRTRKTTAKEVQEHCTFSSSHSVEKELSGGETRVKAVPYKTFGGGRFGCKITEMGKNASDISWVTNTGVIIE